MIVDKKYIEKLRQKCRIPIDESLERCLLEEYGEEPLPYVWSEQDLYEQIRKISDRYESLKKDRDALARYALMDYRYSDLTSCGQEPFQHRNPEF
jgi:hypothetical protein